MKLLNVLLALTVGCSFDGGSGGNGLNPNDASSLLDAALRDGEPGSDTSCPGDVLPFEAENLPSCALMGSNGSLTLTASLDTYVLDTETGIISQNDGAAVVATLNGATLTQSGAPDIFAAVVDSFAMEDGARVIVTGNATLALVTGGNVTVNGHLSVGARGVQPGPGGNHATSCATRRGDNGPVQTDEDGQDGGAGGGGAAFATAGGTGAIVNTSGEEPTPSGAALAAASFSPALAGCPGGEGGSPNIGNEAAGGGGGGSVEIHAAGSIEVGSSGGISAHGGGGRGVNASFGGGGGGGSGGSILLQGTAIEIEGLVLALGGAGGEGARGNSATDPGQDGHFDDEDAAEGGGGLSNGGDGGDGATGTDPGAPGIEGSNNGALAAGGGGGGGGVGQIRLIVPGGSPTGGGTVNPPAM